MSLTSHWTASAVATPEIAVKIRNRSLIVGLVFAAIAAFGAFTLPGVVFMQAYLLGYIAWLGLSLGCLGWLMIHYIAARGGWGLTARRIWEAGAGTLPLMAVLVIPILLNLKTLYIWARPEAVAVDKHLQYVTSVYLSPSMVTIRAVIYFVLWIGMAYLLTRWSAKQDLPENEGLQLPFQWVAAPGMVVFALTATFAVVDLVMSLTPAWASSIYGLIFVAGDGLACMAFTIVITVILCRYQPMATMLTKTTLHDYGKWCFAVIMLWAYFSFSQWLIIWSGNLPEEIGFFKVRLDGGWQYVSLFIVMFHWAVPWAILLSRDIKRNTQTLVPVACWILFMRLVDIFWYIKPNLSTTFNLNLWDVVVPVAMGGLWLAYFFFNLSRRPLVPLYAPFSTQVLEGEHGHD